MQHKKYIRQIGENRQFLEENIIFYTLILLILKVLGGCDLGICGSQTKDFNH